MCVCLQVTAITTSAESCEQHISYSCRMSRLLNTPGKRHFFNSHWARFRVWIPRGPGTLLWGVRICVLSGYCCFPPPKTTSIRSVDELANLKKDGWMDGRMEWGHRAFIITTPPVCPRGCQAGFSKLGSRQLGRTERLAVAHGQWLIGASRCVHAFILQASVAREHLSQLSKTRNWKEAAANNCQGDVWRGGGLSQWYHSVGNDGQRPQKKRFYAKTMFLVYFFFFTSSC